MIKNLRGASALVFEGITKLEVLEAHACTEAQALGEDLLLNKNYVDSNYVSVVNEFKSMQHLAGYCMIATEFISHSHSFSQMINAVSHV